MTLWHQYGLDTIRNLQFAITQYRAAIVHYTARPNFMIRYVYNNKYISGDNFVKRGSLLVVSCPLLSSLLTADN